MNRAPTTSALPSHTGRLAHRPAIRTFLRIVAYAALAALLVVLAFTLCRRAIVLSDEGYLLLEAQEILRGKVLYRDLDSFVAPGVWFLLAALFAVFEPSVLISRLPAMGCYLATAFFIWRIVRLACDHRYAIAALVGYAVLTVWTFPAWTFSFYSPYSILFALMALERTLVWTRSVRARDALLAGVAVGLSAVFKQNFGAYAGIGVALAVLVATFARDEAAPGQRAGLLLRTAVAGVAGGAAVIGPVIVYLAANGALDAAYEQLVVAPFSKFATQHTVPYLSPSELWHNTLLIGKRRLMYLAYALSSTGFLLHASPALVSLVTRLHVVLYLLPPLLVASALALVVFNGRRTTRVDMDLLTIVFVAGLVFLGVFPRADYNHLAHVYQPILVLAVVLCARTAALAGATFDHAWPSRLLALSGAGALALYGLVAAQWYADILRSHDSRVVHARGGVLVNPVDAQLIDFEVAEMRARTREGEPVLTLPGLAMLNFIADRPMPSRYVNLYAVHIAHDQGAGVAAETERAGTDWVVADYNDFFTDKEGLRDYAPALAEYVRRTFGPIFNVAVDRHVFMRRRETPLPDSQPIDVRRRCDAGENPFATRSVRSHLLFDSLYHRLVARELDGWRIADTVCELNVPANARLYGMLAYRQPAEVAPGARLRARIWALPAADVNSDRWLLPEDLERIAPVFDRTIPVETATDWATPAPQEFRADLSAVAGQAALLIFRTEVAGTLAMNALDFGGFSAVWHDLRFESDRRP